MRWFLKRKVSKASHEYVGSREEDGSVKRSEMTEGHLEPRYQAGHRSSVFPEVELYLKVRNHPSKRHLAPANVINCVSPKSVVGTPREFGVELDEKEDNTHTCIMSKSND